MATRIAVLERMLFKELGVRCFWVMLRWLRWLLRVLADYAAYCINCGVGRTANNGFKPRISSEQALP